jgi:hypothetical protein
MNIYKVKVSGIKFDTFVNLLGKNLPFDYENHSKDMTVLCSEDFYLRNKSTQMNMIIIIEKDGSLHLDIIGGAGGTGFFNINFGSEKSYINKVRRVLEDNKDNYNFRVEFISSK